MEEKKSLSGKQQVRAILGVAKLSFKIAPGAVIFKLTGALLDAILPLVTTYYAALTTSALVQAYGGNDGAGDDAIRYVIITAILGIILMVWQSLDSYIQAKMRYDVESRVSDRMYEHFLSLDFWRYDDKETADLYDRAHKFSQFFAWVFDRIATVLSQMIGLISALVALAVFLPWLALFVLIAVIPGIFIQFKLSRKQISHWNKNVEVRRAQNLLEWHFQQPRMIAELRLYGMVKFLLGHRRKLRDADEKARIGFERQYIPLRLLSDLLQALTELGVLLWITVQIINRNQPVGQFVYVQQIVSRAMNSASSFISTLATIDEDIANLYDYEQFMQLPRRHSGGRKIESVPEEIKLDNVSFSYLDSESKALDNVSLSIKRGQHVAIVGENGAGKSTLIKILTGLYEPSSGSMQLDGTLLKDIDISSWHSLLGVLQQEFIHYNFATAADNVRYGMVNTAHSDERLLDALEKAEARKFVDKLPKGADSYVNKWMESEDGVKGVDLSGGQWQRLALARDFYRDAPIIILDEPTSAIDALAEARIFKRLFSDRKRTVITISHRLSTVEKADVIYVLEDGLLKESGLHKDLVARKGVYYRLFESQL